ncbi:MAG TPA: peptidoglycan-associated lipoprotein Pal [Terriglobales bacterium]|nr:peptidoglycan-associated lipoprotein Pal [Terriglobales bacterium]
MKKFLIYALAIVLVFSFAVSCKKKPKEVPPPPPQAQEQPKVEKVEQPVVKEPVLSEEDIYLQKSLEQINKEKPLANIYFDYDKALIRDDARPVLEANSGWLAKFKTIKILIAGNCDERGTEEYNMALGEKRAKAAMDYLATLGVSAGRMKIISYGKSQPVDPGHNEAAWQKNRRDEFLVIEK